MVRAVLSAKNWGCMVYARRAKGMVLIRTDKNYLVAPENPEKFVEELKKLIKPNSFSKKYNP
jgi:hypothetical protein